MLRAQDINVAGPFNVSPLYLKWFQEYQAQTGIGVRFQSMTAGNGVRHEPFPGSIDFSILEAPMYDAEFRNAGPGILNLPVVAHAVAIVYNLPGLAEPLRLTGPIIADIYLGRITRWNDPQIARLNPGATLPDLAVTPFHQWQGSGTTYVFTSYLSAISFDWKSSVGAGKSVRWPVGLGGKGSTGAARIQAVPGSISYLDLSYVQTAPLSLAAVQNADGQFVVPSVASTEAAASAVKLPRDMRASIVNSPAPLGYPLTGYFYVFAYKNPTNPKSRDLIVWILTKGQQEAASFGYARLPPAVRKQALAALTGR